MGNDRYVFWAEGVGKSFGSREVLKSAAVWAERGKITTLMGRNGSGKTTLMRIGAGVLRADQGVVSLFGQVMERPRLSVLARRGLMFLPQGRVASSSFTVRDHFLAVAAVFGKTGVDRAISIARMNDVLDHPVSSLSGGEQGRLSLGLAFARAPTVLLADEPLVGLAPVDQEELAGALRAMAEDGVAVVTSGHDTPTLLSVSDVIIWSAAGTTHHIGSPAEALVHHQFCREYLGPRFQA